MDELSTAKPVYISCSANNLIFVVPKRQIANEQMLGKASKKQTIKDKDFSLPRWPPPPSR